METIKNRLLQEEGVDDWQSHFCDCRIEALASPVLDEDSRKHLAPDTSFIIEQERNMKWQGHLMSREDELKRQTQYGSADGDVRVRGPDSLCMQNPAPPYPHSDNLCVCWVWKEMMWCYQNWTGVCWVTVRRGVHRNIICCEKNQCAGSELIYW